MVLYYCATLLNKFYCNLQILYSHDVHAYVSWISIGKYKNKESKRITDIQNQIKMNLIEHETTEIQFRWKTYKE